MEYMGRDGTVTREDVVNAYRLLLGREPENESVVRLHLANPRPKIDLVRDFISSEEFRSKVPPPQPNPLSHFNASIDVEQIVRSAVNPRRVPLAGHYVNFLGVAIPTKVFSFLEDKGGQLDHVPIPANFHADMAEFAAVLRAVSLAKKRFAMLELGCGWGCWMSNTAVAAKSRGLSREVIGIEGDEKHLGFARETMAANGISSSEYRLLRGIAASRSGDALFPTDKAENWGKEPKFNLPEAEAKLLISSGDYERVTMIALEDAIGDRDRLDLVHMDIQGGEATLVSECIDLLTKRVHYLVIGTHSRVIEGRLFDVLHNAGWELEVERPAILRLEHGKAPFTSIDGVQGWRNPQLD
jgi:hypothetical protein